jgi:hypothetical protein
MDFLELNSKENTMSKNKTMALILLLLASVSFGATLNVGAGQTYETLYAAIDAVSSDDTIQVHSNTTEPDGATLSVYETGVSIIGGGFTSTIADTGSHAVSVDWMYLAGDTWMIQDLNFISHRQVFRFGEDFDNLTVTDCSFTQTKDGLIGDTGKAIIYVSGAADNQPVHHSWSNCRFIGLSSLTSPPFAFYFTGLDSSTFSNITFSGIRQAFDFKTGFQSNDITIDGCSMLGITDLVIDADALDDLTFSNCEVSGSANYSTFDACDGLAFSGITWSGRGIEFDTSDNISFDNCAFSGEVPASDVAIRNYSPTSYSGFTVTNSTFTDYSYSLLFSTDATEVGMAGVSISGNTFGTLPSDASGKYIETGGTPNAQIFSNTFYGPTTATAHGIIIGSDSGDDVQGGAGGQAISVDCYDNTILNWGNEATALTNYHFLVVKADSASIYNNSFTGDASAISGANGSCIYAKGARNAQIINNDFDVANMVGVRVNLQTVSPTDYNAETTTLWNNRFGTRLNAAILQGQVAAAFTDVDNNYFQGVKAWDSGDAPLVITGETWYKDHNHTTLTSTERKYAGHANAYVEGTSNGYYQVGLPSSDTITPPVVSYLWSSYFKTPLMTVATLTAWGRTGITMDIVVRDFAGLGTVTVWEAEYATTYASTLKLLSCRP